MLVSGGGLLRVGGLVLQDDQGWDPEIRWIPLMAVKHAVKKKTGPVLDYREVNKFIESSGVDTDICAEKLRDWRCFPPDCMLIDLDDTYMQVCAHPLCSAVQRVHFEGATYELRHMGFGLACAPQILKAIVSCTPFGHPNCAGMQRIL